jgi:hypothetical protein
MNLTEKATIRHYLQHRIATYQNGTVEALGWSVEASLSQRGYLVNDFTIPGYPESSSDKNSEIGSRSHLI